MITFSTLVRNARLRAVAVALDTGLEGAALQVYSGVRPAAGAPPGEAVLLITVRFPKPCWTSVDGGRLVFAPLPETLSSRSGTPSWARLLDGDGRFVADLDAGLPDSGADLVIDPVPIYAGGAVSFSLAELVEP